VSGPDQESPGFSRGEEVNYQDIATRLDLPINTVRTRLRRARLQLAELLVARQAIG
jgi:DNA-directed RNA polymerase specialized sigma24 family protein